MKQMKNKSQKSAKQPINVQLSKDDLKELLVVLKDFMSEEISIRNKRLFLNQSEMDRRITTLEIVENSHRKEIQKLKQHCSHDDKLDHISYSRATGMFLAAVYKCKWCGREDWKNILTRKEEKSLRKLGVEL